MDFQAEQQHKGHTLLLSEIQRLANLGFWEWDVSHNTVTWSSELYAIYGIEPDQFEASFEGYLKMLHPDDRDRVFQIIQGALENKSEVNFFERICRPDGTIRYLKSWGAVNLDMEGNVAKMFGVCLDVTESKLQELSLQAREEELEQRILDRTRELEDQKNVIQEQKESIEKMLKETHHRVKNNMQIISSLLRLQSSFSEDPKVLEMFEDCQSRIHTMGLIHEKMYQKSIPDKVDSRPYLTNLVQEILNSYARNHKLTADINVDSMELGSAMLVPLGMIINEIIVNSTKHAFTEDAPGTILFELKRSGENSFEMVIGDDGKGVDHTTLKQGSLGMDLIQTFVDQLDGKMFMAEGKGTVYRFVFPIV